MRSPTRRRPRRNHGRTFYTTALIITLFTCYSLLRNLGNGSSHRAPSVAARSLDARDLECRLVHHASDKCAFVKSNCPDEEAGLISYLQFYYCHLPHARPLAFIILVVWVCLLFSTIGMVASDFLCINLSTIASILGMSESLTGVTFLAFGNGSPDVFSTFAAMSSNSGSLAVGELMGAAGFITAVVAGSMALVAPFQVARKSFVRDVGFFVVAASFSLVFLADGSLRFWECAVMVGYYVCYVVFVVVWHWWLTRRRRIRLAETTARLGHYIPDSQELEVPELEEDEESRPASERTGLLHSASNESVPTLRSPGTPAWRVEDLDDDDEARDRYLAELQSKMRVSRPPRGERRNTITPIRPSLIGALEFRALMTSLGKKSTTAHSIGLRRYSSESVDPGRPNAHPHASQPTLVGHSANDLLDVDQEPHGQGVRGRAVSANDAASLRIDTDFLSDMASERHAGSVLASGASSLAPPAKHTRASANILRTLNEPSNQRQNPPSPKLVLSPAESQHQLDTQLERPDSVRSPSLLAPPTTSFHQPDYDEEHHDENRSPLYSPRTGPSLQVPILHTPHPDHKQIRLHQEDFPPYTDSPVSSGPPSMHLPEPSMSPESIHDLQLLPDEEEEPRRHFSWWPYAHLPAPQDIIATVFPTLRGWREKSFTDRMLSLVTAPSVFVLTITLPVVEPREERPEDVDPDLLSVVADYHGGSHNHVNLPSDTPALAPKRNPSEVEVLGSPHPHETNLARTMSDYPKDDHTPSGTDGFSAGQKDWNRWLVFVQVFTAPLCVVSIVWANMDEEHTIKVLIRLILGSLVFSLVALLIILSLTSADREPKYRPLLCFLGFAVAIAWISTIANEVVGVLKAFGVILGISDAILGLTIFAVGNSLGDLVADITVAKLGYPVMALSACFGGPMLNILLGIGIGGMYMTVHQASHKHAKHPHRPIEYQPYQIEVSTTLMISGITLLVTLVGLLIVVPLNGWRMDRKIGLGLIALWTLSTIGNVVVEILGYGGDTV
ncbi:hypothetical protein A1O1_01447 [Capronia coronata CBS 617.96]|uniref:Sodium/calcium exchanger membrane region domain-containing protein n=1 Tax=Capronia coronata CBS 617.96 TaxID=1182541 RepID=W9Z400_9EURO|nr:uncharacterized protein A1O1_01447 [Capronia coronata CBS 617.96]EXJ96321.1 hypothetical protein A1O1_01447 [Capronia coronata CBS 617.96]